MTHLLSRPLSPSPSRTRNKAHLLSIPPAARSSPDGLRAHAFTHVVGRTIVSIRLSTPASQTTWSFEVIWSYNMQQGQFEVRGHFTYHWTLFWTWNNSSRICSPIGTKNFDLFQTLLPKNQNFVFHCKKVWNQPLSWCRFITRTNLKFLLRSVLKIFLWFSYLPLVLAQQRILD